MPRSESSPAVLRELSAATDRNLLDRKLLVCASMGEGRELLRALSAHRAWIGWDVTTLRRLAMDLVTPSLVDEGLEVTDAFEEQALVDAALDAALAREGLASLRQLGEAPGFREAVVNAVSALRLAGIEPGRLRSAPSSNREVRALLAAVLDGYRRGVAEARRIDTASVLERAVERVRGGAGFGGDAAVAYLVPGLSLRGAGGRLVEALLEAGASALESDPVEGVEPGPVLWHPSAEPAPYGGLLAGRGPEELDLFAASGPAEEVREVLRRVMAEGLSWDEVEIVATDPVVYGGALHALAERLDIPVSYAVGLPVERTRAGRSTVAWFRWIQTGYPADVVRRLLESGDLRAPGAPDAGALARRLRRLRVGWGRERYLPAIDRALARLEGPPRAGRNETEDEAVQRVARERAELESLRSLLAPILRAAPKLDPLGGEARIAPARVATGLTAFLDHVAAADEPSATALERLRAVADRVAATLDRPAEASAAIAAVRSHLEVRVPAPRREGSAPWVSAGGHLHLSDVEHGGYTGRKATFVVGLDADRFPGAGLQDPLLLDAQRRALDPRALPTSGDRMAATRFRLAACLARLRGRVTLSYSAWDPAEAREVAPSSVMLQAFRARERRPEASFEDLGDALGAAASAIPGTTALDATDVWLDALEVGGILRDGAAVVRRLHPRLDRGLSAQNQLEGDAATAYHGLIRPRPDRLDPRRNRELTLSASGLEDLGTCSLRYFYRYALRVRPTDDPEHDPDAWLDALRRGSLLHSVYEGALRAAREQGVAVGGEGFVELAMDVLERDARRIERDVPAPGRAVREREMRALREDVRSFAAMLEENEPDWEHLELMFGLRGEPTAELRLKGGTLRLRGAIDRVDRHGAGLTVVDYKTGSTSRYERRHGTFNGGRRLQNVVYAAVAETLLDRRVEAMEYHFPTRKGQNEVVPYRRDELMRGLGLIDRLLDAVAAGRFLPTEEGGDCRFCDYATICRHSSDGFRSETPRSDWVAERLEELPELRERREARAWEELFLAELEDHDA